MDVFLSYEWAATLLEDQMVVMVDMQPPGEIVSVR